MGDYLTIRSDRASGDSEGPPPRYFVQKQDHFDGSNAQTWLQAYYVNDTFWKPGSDAPVFLCVGGEGPALTGAAVESSVHCNVAVEFLKDTQALMFAVEHRYYGCHNMSACPVSSFAEPARDLRFLSSRQALADLAEFHAHATDHYGLTGNNKWVTFGGSYPGMLAGWARLRFPHLFHASIASSAPVQAKLDFPEYNDVTRYAYTVTSVGGSGACAEAIAQGHAEIGKLLGDASGRELLSRKFKTVPNASWLEDREHQREFAGEGVAYFPSQGNDPACESPACNIGKICAIMTDSKRGDAVNRLAAVAESQAQWLDASSNNADVGWVDYWGWQTCTEFGFYQTCEVGSQCFYTQGLDTLQDNMAFCTEIFGIEPSTVASNVNYTNVYYGALKPVGTRVLWPNGEVDPWSALSVLKSPQPGQPTLWVKGASHHFWTHPSASTDQQSVVQARAAIRRQIWTWLQDPSLTTALQ
ncbi:hypothetical protein CYMTET_7739 [Cymbomonas tetramitiformis]|uniref:Thymus-specific serine protease n=1 Tax=Cymbomonas tetramitiformis TaxID=36881 RepID=A0AAE0GUF3_9CHLO|nr:hypothetical protein CYMTET_7739 [Cymbomonas tetramitiformis]